MFYKVLFVCSCSKKKPPAILMEMNECESQRTKTTTAQTTKKAQIFQIITIIIRDNDLWMWSKCVRNIPFWYLSWHFVAVAVVVDILLNLEFANRKDLKSMIKIALPIDVKLASHASALNQLTTMFSEHINQWWI